VLPLVFPEGASADTLGISGYEEVDLLGLPASLRPGGTVLARFRTKTRTVEALLVCRVETEEEAEDLRSGGTLPNLFKGPA
jgi:aconitate hydratase